MKRNFILLSFLHLIAFLSSCSDKTEKADPQHLSYESIHPIPFEEFIEKEPKDEAHYGSYDIKDVYSGKIQNLHPTEKQRFLITYNRGLKDQEYDEIFALQDSDPDEFILMRNKVNTNGQILFDGKSVSKVIEKPESLGFAFKFISEEEIWFTPNFEHIEKDYSVFYKTRIISK